MKAMKAKRVAAAPGHEGHEGKEGGSGSAGDEGHEGEKSGRGTGHEGHEGVRRSTVCQWQFECTCLPAHSFSVTGQRGSLGAAGPNRPPSLEGAEGVRRRLGVRCEVGWNAAGMKKK